MHVSKELGTIKEIKIKPHYDMCSPVVYKFLLDYGHNHDFCNKFKSNY